MTVDFKNNMCKTAM